MTTARVPNLPVRLAVHGAVYLAALTMLLPFLWMVGTSLKSDAEALSGSVSLWPRAWAWGNYAEAVRSANLGRYYGNSLVVAGVTTVLAGAHCALAGFALAKLRFRGREGALWLCLVTMMLPITVFFIFAYRVCAWLGFINNYQALIVPFLASGFGVYYMRQAIAAVPDALLEAGRVDGMSDVDLFRHVAAPAVWPAIAALGIVSFVNSWNSFFWPLIVVDSDGMKTLPLAVAELASGQYVQSWPVRMAAATILTAPLVVVFLVFQRAFIRGVTMTGVKE